MKKETKFKILRLVKKILNYYDQPPYIQIETQRVIQLRVNKKIQKVELEHIPMDVFVTEMGREILDKIIDENYLKIIKTPERDGMLIEIQMYVITPK